MKMINLSISLFLLISFSVLAQFQNTNLTNNEYEQSEVMISVNPINPKNLFVVYNDFRSINGNNYPKPGYAFSNDDGLTWNIGLFEHDDFGFYNGFDPSGCFDKNENAYYCYIGTNNPSQTGPVYLSKTSDMGINWTGNQISAQTINQDKPWMTVDNSGGAYDGRLYFSWTDFSQADSRIKFCYSSDQGNSFSDEIVLAQVNQEPDESMYIIPRSSPMLPSLTGSVVQGSIPIVGSNGDIFVIWLFANTITGSGAIYMKRSTDGGITFSMESLVTELTLFHSEQFYYISTSLPSIAVDKNGNIYITYSEGYGNYLRLREIKSTNFGESWSEPLYITNNTNVLQQFSTISVDENGKITIFFQEDNDEYISESFDEGNNFLTPIKITNNPFNYNALWSYHYQGMKNTKGGDSYCVWTDLSTSQVDIYFSKANSLIYFATENLSLDEGATNYNGQRKLIKDSLGNYNLVFSSFGEIFFKLSTDNGITWTSIDHISNGEGICSNPSITTYDDYIFVTWQQYNGIINGQHKYKIKGAYKNINGSTWNSFYIFSDEVTFSTAIDPLPVITATANVDNNYSSDDNLPEVMIVLRKNDGIYHINLFYESLPHDDIEEGYEQKGLIHKISNTYTGYSNPSITVNGIGLIMLTCNSSFGNLYAFSTTGGNWSNYSYNVFSTSDVYNYQNSCITSDGTNNFQITWKGLNHKLNTTSIMHKKLPGVENPITEFTYGSYESYEPSSFGHLDQNGGVSIYWNTGTEIKRVINNGARWDYSGHSFIQSVQNDGNYVNSIDRDDPNYSAYAYTGIDGPLYDVNPVITSGLAKITENLDTIQTLRKVDYYDEELDVLLGLQIGNFRLVDPLGNISQLNPEYFNENCTFQNFGIAISKLLSDSFPNSPQNKIIFDYNFEMKNLYQLRAGNNNNPRINFQLKNRKNGNILFSTDTIFLSLDTTFQNYSGTQEILLNGFNQNNNISLILKLQGIHQNYLNLNENFKVINTYLIKSGQINKKSDSKINLMFTKFELSDNFPNPFNPYTTINYQIPEKSFVTLKVYDILGREVAILVNEIKKQGRYSANFDASKLASGVYIYQIRANDYVSSRKMLLVK